MFKKIMVPVDLAHADKIEKAIATAADLAKHYGIPVAYVGVASSAPGGVAHDPDEFSQKLREFSNQQASQHGIDVTAKAVVCDDPAVELDSQLREARKELAADLLVIGSHQPGIMEHLVSSNAGYLAQHSEVSVFVVR